MRAICGLFLVICGWAVVAAHREGVLQPAFQMPRQASRVRGSLNSSFIQGGTLILAGDATVKESLKSYSVLHFSKLVCEEAKVASALIDALGSTNANNEIVVEGKFQINGKVSVQSAPPSPSASAPPPALFLELGEDANKHFYLVHHDESAAGWHEGSKFSEDAPVLSNTATVSCGGKPIYQVPCGQDGSGVHKRFDLPVHSQLELTAHVHLMRRWEHTAFATVDGNVVWLKAQTSPEDAVPTGMGEDHCQGDQSVTVRAVVPHSASSVVVGLGSTDAAPCSTTLAFDSVGLSVA